MQKEGLLAPNNRQNKGLRHAMHGVMALNVAAAASTIFLDGHRALIAGGVAVTCSVLVLLVALAATRLVAADMKQHLELFDQAQGTSRQIEELFAMTDMLQAAEDPAATLLPGNCWALKRGKPHINDASLDTLCCMHHIGSVATVEVPMMARGQVFGLLMLAYDGAEAFQNLKGIRRVTRALADSMSLALSNIALREKLRTQSLRDPLGIALVERPAGRRVRRRLW